MQRGDPADGLDRTRQLRLFLGIVLSWLAPNAIFTAFMQTADLRSPFDSVVAMDPAFIAYGVGVALLAGGLITGRYRALLAADRAGAAADSLTRRIKALFVALPLFVAAYVLLGAVLMVVFVSDAYWSGADIAIAGMLATLVVIQIIVPLGILCLDEFGVAFGHLVSDQPVLPGFLRNLPVLLLSLMIGFMQPLYEYARFGEISLASMVLVGLILPYALAVTMLNLRYGSDALRSVFAFLASVGSGDRLHLERLQPQALDEFGVLTARTRDLVGQIDATRARLEESEARLRTFAEAASDWFYELDADLRFVWVSTRIVDSIGVSSSELLGLSVAELGERYASPDWAALLDQLERREPIRGFQLSLDIGGSEGNSVSIHLELSALPIVSDAGAFTGYRGNGTDVSAVVEARKRLREREAQLAQAQKMEAVGQLTGGIAHDFNNLLTAVAGSLELLRMRHPEMAEERLVREALSASRRAGDLVQRLLTFSRRQALRPEVVDVGEKLREMAELLGRTLGVGIVVEVDVPHESIRALVDPAQFESAVLNLAINARDAMGGAGRVRLEVSAVDIEQAEQALVPGEYVRVVVEDEGAGIEPDVLPHVLEPFFSTKPDGAGSGLGLSMVFGFVRQTGGDLRLESEPGRGTRIEMLLPRARAEVHAAAATGTHQALSVAAQARVLVVEDEPSVMAVVTEALELVGCRVVHAETGEAGVAMLDADDALDLVLSDVLLPGDLTGVDVVRHARARRPGLPCVLMSGYARQHLSEGAADIADVPVLGKPFRLEQLITTVTGVLDDRRASVAAVAD